jgi:hypothetical protein
MPSPVPTPVAAALGLVPTVLGGVRRLPTRAVQLPVYAVSHALTGLGTARREYDALAERGERLLTRLRGTSFDEVEDRVEDRLQGTPLEQPYDTVEDALEDATEAVSALVSTTTTRARKAAGATARTAGSGLDKAADKVDDAAGATARKAPRTTRTAGKAADRVEKSAESVAGTAAETAGKAAEVVGEDTNEAEAPKGRATPKATEPDTTRIDTAANSEVVETVEEVSAKVGSEVPEHDELPLPDYDHLTLGSLRGRMRSLDLPQLIQIRDYEKAHADRLPIVTMLDNRIAKLANDPTAPLSDAPPTADVPAKPKPSRSGSKVTPATGGPAQNPPSQGVPTNPAQPRTAGPGTNPASDA